MNKFLTTTLAAAAATAALALAPAAAAHADPVVGSKTELWGFLGTQRRTLLDGPIHPDGSWLRERVIWTPAHTTPVQSSCFGSNYVSCSTWGGQFVEQSVQEDQTYPVTPDTVLPDEPGHLG